MSGYEEACAQTRAEARARAAEHYPGGLSVDGILQRGYEHGFVEGAQWRDRWLTEHDRQLRAETLEEAARMADSRGHLWSGAPSTEFFKLADEIRAAAIRSGEQ